MTVETDCGNIPWSTLDQNNWTSNITIALSEIVVKLVDENQLKVKKNTTFSSKPATPARLLQNLN